MIPLKPLREDQVADNFKDDLGLHIYYMFELIVQDALLAKD